MSNRIHLLALVVLCVLALTPAGPSAENIVPKKAWATFSNPALGYSFRYPKSLHVVRRLLNSFNIEGLAEVIDLESSAGTETPFRVLVTVPTGSLTQAKEDVESLRKVCKSYREFRIDGRPAIDCVTCGSAACSWEVHVPGNPTFVMLSFTNQGSRPGAVDKPFEVKDIIGSFRWTAAVGACPSLPARSRMEVLALARNAAKRLGAHKDELLEFDSTFGCESGRAVWFVTLGHRARHFGVDYSLVVGDRDAKVTERYTCHHGARCATMPIPPAGYRHLPTEAEIVAFAQGVSVRSIDSTMGTDLSLAEWVLARSKDKKVSWESNDCGEQTGDPRTTPQDVPACVEAQFQTCTGVSASITVIVGSSLAGLAERVQLFMAYTGAEPAAVDYRTLTAMAAAAPACKL